MARLGFADLTNSDVAPLVQRIIAERGEVLDLYGMLLHSPPLAEGWLAFLTAVRQRTMLRADLREMLIMRIAHLNRAPYEADQHEPFARAVDVSEAKLSALAAEGIGGQFSPEERDVLNYCDAITRRVQVDDVLFQTLRERFDARELVELTVLIASYNMVSRFLEAFEIRTHA